MRRGMVGCLLSHVKIYTELIYSDFDFFVILEDDIEFTTDFYNKFISLFSQVKKDWDLIFLGHHVRDKNKQSDELDKNTFPIITKRDAYWSFLHSLGGTGGYIITKSGAQKLLDSIDKTGATNGIDTLIQKSANVLNIYYPSPHLIFTDCYRGDNQNLDTDIQFDYDSSLVKSLEQRLSDELNFYNNNIKYITDFEEAKTFSESKELKDNFYFKGNDNEIDTLKNICQHQFYTLENSIIFVVPHNNKITRYFHRFKKNGKYDISDVF
jgi:GR25 family glycosyltransferase involved in LPS biosynthesis